MGIGRVFLLLAVVSITVLQMYACRNCVVCLTVINSKVSILLLSPVRSKAEQTLASSECLAPLCHSIRQDI